MRTIAIGIQNFGKIIENNYFYVDKTDFIVQWWKSGDDVTLIARPRRFGKTLTMSMVEQFFSVDYAGGEDLFKGLSVWGNTAFRTLQGKWPVLFLSFADIKETTFLAAREKICLSICDLYNRYDFLKDSGLLNEREREFFERISPRMEDQIASLALKYLSDFLTRYYGKKVIILLDEYDTPLQESYVFGYWKELASFLRNLFNATFKTNPFLERAIMTGITRVSRESIFSDLNNLKVVTTTSEEYAECFGFTQKEVEASLREYGLEENMDMIRKWYDGFTFGNRRELYNPWSILNYLDTKKAEPYWANTSSNSLISKLIREGSKEIKISFEKLLKGEKIVAEIDEQIVFSQLDEDERAIWSLLLASGYLKAEPCRTAETSENEWKREYELSLTNFEVKLMFRKMIQTWFGRTASDYNDFVRALLSGDVEAMNEYMNRVALRTFSSFDVGNHPSGKSEPERFYHGFVLGLLVDLADRYILTSNRESGFGRYDVCLEPLYLSDDGILLEFKVFQPAKEKNLEETIASALRQIEEKNYASHLIAKGIPPERIRKYGFAFEGKRVLIGG